MTDTKALLQQAQLRVNNCLIEAIKQQTSPYNQESINGLERLQQASLYSIENGGKRLRPALFFATISSLEASLNASDSEKIAAAIECIHSYSLVHDDLPAMDDDDLRRGKPTCHIAFDEATAILVGDGLQSLAFELLSQVQTLTAETIVKLVQELAQAAGNYGMVGGQMIDLHSTGKNIKQHQLEHMHRLKTGALIRSCTRMAAIAANASEAEFTALDNYAKHLGLAFQVHDDILDIESDTETLGKTQGADQQLNKQTYPAILGLEQAKSLRDELIAKANTELDTHIKQPDTLHALASFVISRNH